ncbi:MAG: AMP-binding protein [Kastovskya adunca ATA6-11-RM4]|jgi:non-ribosomal peptide synthase protein (TIGR01720 family)|nr:AMP-binding protein [Kastovskya adunca ATA6-11-RM4]
MAVQIIEGFQLSPQQKRLWSLQRDSLAYQTQGAILIEGNLNPEVLKIALQNVINRHEILRTTFQRKPGIKAPLQVVADSSILCCRDINLSGLDSKQQEFKIEEILQEERQQELNFEQTLLRFYLLILSAQKHILLISLPAICADGKTLKNLVVEISQSYTASLQGEELSDEDEVVQYVQFSEWQNQLLEDEDGLAGKEYWSKQDFSALATLALPFENKLSNVPAQFEFNSLECKVEPDVVAKIEAIAQKCETSVSTVLLTCWQVLLWRLTGQQDIIIGTAFDGRPYEELERSLGLFAKHLPLTCHFEAESKFSELLAQVNQSVHEAYEWQEYFTELEHCIDVAFLPFGFEYEQWSSQSLKSNVHFSLSKHYICLERFKVKLSCDRNDDSIVAAFKYDSNYFLEDDIKRLAERFSTLLESIISKPEAAASNLNILSDRERQQLLIEFNHTAVDYPKEACIHKLFEDQAARTPDNIAVVFEEQQLTYRELNSRANKLAHYLQQLGVKPDVLVGLFVERSLDLIVGLLGILKAGGAYLPLDPALPPSGIALRLQEAQSLLISQESLVKSKELLTNDQEQRTIICLDTDWEKIERECSGNPTSDVKPENLVYAIYTSGSTGVPKGVAIEHQQLLNYLYSIQETINLPTGASYATVSTFAADLGNTVIFPALCSGGCLHIVCSDRASDPQALADYFQRHPIDCIKIVPSHLKALLTGENPQQLLPRQRLVLGGEACSWDLIRQIQQLAPECQILNHYGPTEATVGVLTYAITNNLSTTKSVAKFASTVPNSARNTSPPAPLLAGEGSRTPPCPCREGGLGGLGQSSTVPIGRPIPNTQIYLLDSNGQPVPIGVPGELHIGGAGLARGYLHRPELTAEKFINNPFISGRVYKTGDLARYLPDGTLEFLGRIDRQVKIHGFRIELGEIEAALLKHPGVSETAVIVQEDEPDNKRLVAYVVPKHKSAPTSSELRSFLLEWLPEYMVPSFFVQLKALPLTPNGKVNRQMLPAPDASRPELKEAYVPPRTPTEEKLANLWAEVLKVERVGIHDNFFELGGDSIISIQIVARAHQVCIEIAPKQLFENQTIAELAAVANLSQGVMAEQGRVTGSVPLTPIQHWFFEQNQPDSHHWNQAVLLQVKQALDPMLLQKALQRSLEHHDALRLRFVEAESGWQQINADFNGMVPFQYLDLSVLSPEQQKAAIEEAATELQTSLNLSEEPLMRVALFNLGDSQRLLIVIHHLVVDGVSWRILLEDFQTAYEQLSRGEAIALPSKTTSFKHWAERLRDYAHSEAVQQEQDYWLAQARTSVPRLPVDYVGGDNTQYYLDKADLTPPAPLPYEGRGESDSPLLAGEELGERSLLQYCDNTVASERTVSVELSVEETQALLQEVPATYRTQINDVLMTALAQSFAQWTGEPSLLVELEGHGREDIFNDVNLSRTVGWFTTHFPVLLDIGDASNPVEALKAVKEQLRGLPNRGIGYGVLRYLNGNRELREQIEALPQPEVKFNYLGQFDQLLSESSLFAPAEESCGQERTSKGSRNRLLVINGLIVSGQLRLDWNYSENIHRRSTIESLAQSFVEALRDLITHCQSPEAGGYTPSDFPQMQFSSKELDELLAEL